MKKKLLFSLIFLTGLSLGVEAKVMKIINFEYNDGTAPLSIERSKVKKITFYVPDVIPFTVGDVTFNMVKVEAGTFIMGATAEQYNPEAWEKPAHQVTLTKDYYMGETEVTQALWEAVMGSNPSSYVGDQLPVTQVSYNDITGENGFISKLNEATGKTFRLPTEAEWEFAARGGNQSRGTQYSGSANIDEVAWYKDNSNRTPHEVATKAPNEIGLYDMTGNVSEWCSDWYELYSNEAQIDPTGPESGDAHVFRDGTFATSAWHSRLAYRDAATPTSTGGGFGFRLAGMQLGADAASKSKISVEYNDGSAPLLIDRLKVKRITLTEDEVITVGDVTFNMIKVKAGTFTMGATSEQQNSYHDEHPTHQVTLTKDYYIGQTEVTQALWTTIMGSDNNPSEFKGDQLPVEKVSYDDVTGENGFIAKLNAATGMTFRLPTEAEWEFASRGGVRSRKYRYSGSNTIDEVAWCKENSENTTHEVATKAPNELGLYDMSGNVFEWCSDWKGRYNGSAQTNPTGAWRGVARIRRGGSWSSIARNCRSSYRGYYRPANTINNLGLRLALSAE